jgi:hypothetical protein
VRDDRRRALRGARLSRRADQQNILNVFRSDPRSYARQGRRDARAWNRLSQKGGTKKPMIEIGTTLAAMTPGMRELRVPAASMDVRGRIPSGAIPERRGFCRAASP